MFGEAGCEFIRKRAELVPVDATDEGGLIDQRGEFVGCGEKRGWGQAFIALLLAPELDQLCERATAAGGGESGRKVERFGAEGRGVIFLFDITQRADVGRQQRAFDSAVERQGKLARGALVGREDQRVGKRFGVFARVGGVDKAARKFVEEGR